MKRMRLRLALALCISALLVLGGTVLAAKPTCTTLQDGVLTYSAGHYLEGELIPLGFDPYGYNYQGHMFKGYYANVYLGRDGFPPYEGDEEAYLVANPLAEGHWAWPYRDDWIVMKWNDAWLSNKDCDGDGVLDRPADYVGSGAWETNHQWGEYEVDGTMYNWNYFCKIVAVPDDAYVDDPYNPVLGEYTYYAADGTEIGSQIWGAFAIIQEVSNDQYLGDHGLLYNAPAPTGFGYYMP